MGLDNVGTNDVVSVTGKQGGTIRRPTERDALDGDSLGDEFLGILLLGEVRLEVRDDELLGLKIPDLDRRGSGGAQPVADRGEAQRMDDVAGLESGEVTTFIEIPEHGLAVLATGSAERTIRGDGDGVDVAGVADQVVAETAVSQRPDLDQLVPTTRND